MKRPNAVVDYQMRSDAPGVLGVNSQALHILREAAVAGGIREAADTAGHGRSAAQVEIKLGRIRGVEARIIGVGKNRFGGGGESAAHHRLMDEIDAKAGRVAAGGVRHIITKLIFFLVAQNRKSGDGSDELIVAEGFEAGDGAAG
jgi:hypothetical protein